MKKNKVLFVGAFKTQAKDGSVGGQMFACQSLIHSDLSQEVEWILIDSTADTVPPPSLPIRAWKALKRVARFSFYLIFDRQIESTLIFSADGFSFLEKGTMALLGKIARKRVILAPRSGLVLNDVERSKFMKGFVSLVSNKVDFLICQSQSWKDFYYDLGKGDIQKYIIQQNWIDTKLYQENTGSYQAKPLGKKLNILYLGWLEEFKGIFDLITAVHLLKEGRGNLDGIQMVICGNGGAFQGAQALVEELEIKEAFDFRGWVNTEQKMKAFQETDIYVLPSHFEGFPNALLEAMASELPVIATTIGAVPDLIQDQEHGLLVPPKSPKDLCSALSSLLENPELREKLASNARKKIIENNSIERVAQRFSQLFKNLVPK